MTDFDLLRLIGEAEDTYVMESRRRPKKRRARWPYALAACLVLAVLGGGGFWGITSMRAGSAAPDQDQTMTASAAAGEAPAEEPEAEAPEEAEEAAPAGAGGTSAYDVTLLAGAAYPETLAAEDYEGRSQRWQENQVSEDTKYALNAFSYSTAAALLRDRTDSGCFSPLSLYQALSILAGGAEGQTRDELLSLLGMRDLETLAEESGKLYRVNYSGGDDSYKLRIANSLWLDETAPDGTPISYKQDWVLSAAQNYYADVYQAEFSGGDTAKALGAWIAENTGGFLDPAPEELVLPEETVMAIVNTVWYKAAWAEPFNEENTEPDEFTTASGETVSADFMHRTEKTGRYVRGEDYIKSKLSLCNGQMIVVLPDEGVDVDSLLTEDRLWEVFENGDYQSAEVRWSVPKFESFANYDLKDALQSLGVTTAFDYVSADFSGISDFPLYLGSARQGTHISVDEEGVEAAAYTDLGMMAGEAAPEEDPEIVEMDLNRPFIYLITANDGSTLFIGVVRSPEG